MKILINSLFKNNIIFKTAIKLDEKYRLRKNENENQSRSDNKINEKIEKANSRIRIKNLGGV